MSNLKIYALSILLVCSMKAMFEKCTNSFADSSPAIILIPKHSLLNTLPDHTFILGNADRAETALTIALSLRKSEEAEPASEYFLKAKSLSPNYQFRQTVDMLENTPPFEKSYLKELILSGWLRKWPQNAMPVGIYIDPQLSGMCKSFSNEVMSSCNEWTDADSYNRFCLTSEKDALIKFSLAKDSAPAGEAGQTTTRINMPIDRDKIGTISGAHLAINKELVASDNFLGSVPALIILNNIVLRLSGLPNQRQFIVMPSNLLSLMRPQAAARRHQTILHELGHAIGLVGHSGHVEDVMFPVDTDFNFEHSLSERDKITLKQLDDSSINTRDTVQQYAKEGDVRAQYLLGELIAAKSPLHDSDPEAMKWYRTAADKGLAEAQYKLGKIYAKGEPSRADLLKAASLFNLAAAQFYYDARDREFDATQRASKCTAPDAAKDWSNKR